MTKDEVTYKDVTFVGTRFGYLPGSWFVPQNAAKKIVKACGVDLPRLGYDRALANGTFKDFLTNHSGHYRLTVNSGNVTHTFLSAE